MLEKYTDSGVWDVDTRNLASWGRPKYVPRRQLAIILARPDYCGFGMTVVERTVGVEAGVPVAQQPKKPPPACFSIVNG